MRGEARSNSLGGQQHSLWVEGVTGGLPRGRPGPGDSVLGRVLERPKTRTGASRGRGRGHARACSGRGHVLMPPPGRGATSGCRRGQAFGLGCPPWPHGRGYRAPLDWSPVLRGRQDPPGPSPRRAGVAPPATERKFLSEYQPAPTSSPSMTHHATTMACDNLGEPPGQE